MIRRRCDHVAAELRHRQNFYLQIFVRVKNKDTKIETKMLKTVTQDHRGNEQFYLFVQPMPAF